MRTVAAFAAEIVVLVDGERITLDQLNEKIDMVLRYNSEGVHPLQLGVYQWDGSSSAWNIRDDVNFTVPVH
ncbi:hypothetical protein ABU162_07880 [Paenibacillus thiaminolyticus]|uniref:hypothetical protein n=1 Tax=Paenibacillus thiaminolyticus TaxID=49283 RepID=UPI0035A5EF94